MWQELRAKLVDNPGISIFMAVYLLAFCTNALLDTKFNLKDLEILAWLLGGRYGVNSVFNTAIPLVGQWRQGGAVSATGKSGGHPDNG